MIPIKASFLLSLTMLTAPLLASGAALAQPFDPGPPGTVVGSSMSGARIGGAPKVGAGRISGAKVFGDTVEERTYGRDYDDSYLKPKVRRAEPEVPIELRATEGRSTLDPLNSGAFARSGPGVISRSGVTRPALGGRARIRP